MAWRDWVRDCLRQMQAAGVRFVRCVDLAATLGEDRPLPVCDLVPGEVDGRSGQLALQRAQAA